MPFPRESFPSIKSYPDKSIILLLTDATGRVIY